MRKSETLNKTLAVAAAVAALGASVGATLTRDPARAGTTQFKIEKGAKGMGDGSRQSTPGGVIGIKPGAQRG
ncbi:MAG TPA: hypothetical protein VLX30_14890 [Burkholderiales bacterium]|nr:hypothetical protein [Burkholderiales bacterium]